MNHLSKLFICKAALGGLFLIGCDQDHSNDDWMRHEGSGTNHHTLKDQGGTGGAAINGDSSGGMKSGATGFTNNGSMSGTGAAAGSGTGGTGGFGGIGGSSTGTNGGAQTPR